MGQMLPFHKINTIYQKTTKPTLLITQICEHPYLELFKKLVALYQNVYAFDFFFLFFLTFSIFLQKFNSYFQIF